MHGDDELERAAQLFKVLGSHSRLRLLSTLFDGPRTVGTLSRETGMSQPLVSQHLRTLRDSGLVTSSRSGKEVSYELADTHVRHVLDDAIVHANEETGEQPASDR